MIKPTLFIAFALISQPPVCPPTESKAKPIEELTKDVGESLKDARYSQASASPLLTQQANLNWPSLNKRVLDRVKAISRDSKPTVTDPKQKDGMVSDLEAIIQGAKPDEFVIGVIGTQHVYDFFFLSADPYAVRYQFLPVGLEHSIGYKKYGYVSGKPEKFGDHAEESQSVMLGVIEKRATQNPERAALLTHEESRGSPKGLLLMDTHGVNRDGGASPFLPSVESLKAKKTKKVILVSELMYTKDPATTPALEMERLKKLSLPYLRKAANNPDLRLNQMAGSQWPNMDDILKAMLDYEANGIQVEVRGVHQ